MLFSHLAHGLKGGLARHSLDGQRNSQSDKPILVCPLNLTHKTAVLHTRPTMHVDGSAVDTQPRLHLLYYLYLSTTSPVFLKETG